MQKVELELEKNVEKEFLFMSPGTRSSATLTRFTIVAFVPDASPHFVTTAPKRVS